MKFGVVKDGEKLPKGCTYIYGLVDPRDNMLRYVGKSIRPLERLSNHLNEKSNCHRSHWLHLLKRNGIKPRIVVLEVVGEGRTWQEAEREWIAMFREAGFNLVNSTDGGDGVTNLSGESKERMAKTWLGRKHKPESLAKIGAASRGRKHTEEYKRMMRELMSKREFNREHRNRISVSSRKFDEQTVEAIRKRLANGERVIDIAREFSVHRVTISKIKMGKYAPAYKEAS